jgi:TolB-like protein/Tfp pilus assembly protein PilF
MQIWSAEIKELGALYTSIKGRFPVLEKDLEHLIKTDDENVALLYSRRCLEIIVTDLCENELRRPRGKEPLKGIIDKLSHDKKVPSNIIASMEGLNTLSTFGTHPKDFDPEQVRPVLINLSTIIKWYVKHKDSQIIGHGKPEEDRIESKEKVETKERITNSKKRLIFLLSGILLVAVIAVVALFIFNIIGGKKEIKEIDKSIAVLPFESLSSDTELQYQADGVMDAILLHLSKIKDLRVMSRTSVEQYRGTKKTIPEICSELGVAYALEGSFQKSGDQMRLIVQLIQAGKEGHVWANNYDREWKEIFSVQSEVAQLVAGEIQSIITPEEMEIMEKAPTDNLDAYDYYLRASQMWHNFTTRQQGLENILQVLDQAIALDPDFAQAYALKGIVLYRMKSYGLPVGTWRDSALALAENAVRIDPDLSDGYVLRGRIKYAEFGMMDEYRKDLQEAYRLAPGNTDVLNYLGDLYLNEGRYLEGASMKLRSGIILYNNKEPNYYYWWGGIFTSAGEYKKAVMLYEQAIRLDPGAYRFHRELGGLYLYYLGDYRKAIDNCLEALKIQPMSTGSITTIALSYLMLGDLDGAEEYFSRFFSVEAEFADSLQYIPFRHRLGHVKWLKGEKEEAMKLIQEEMKLDRETQERIRANAWGIGSCYYDLGIANAFLGNREEAFLWMDSASNFGFFYVWWAENDPLLDSIRQEERFQDILSKQRDKETRIMNAYREVLNQPEFLNQIEWFFKKD